MQREFARSNPIMMIDGSQMG